IVLTPRQSGRLANRVVATADGNLAARDEVAVTVQAAQVRINLSGPARRYLNRDVAWNIQVENPGEFPLNNVVVRDQLPRELALVSASPGGQSVNGEVIWPIGTLGPHQQKSVKVATRCAQLTPRSLHVAIVTADPGLRAQSEAPIEILGLPAFRLRVRDESDPVAVGGRKKYRIDFVTQGSLAGNQIEIKATVPAEMRLVNANGPVQPRVAGQEIAFPPVDSLPPGQKLSYTVEV